MEEEVLAHRQMETQIVQDSCLDAIAGGIQGEETQILSAMSTSPQAVLVTVEEENESVAIPEEITMEERGIDLQIVEESGTMYVISSVLDEETGEMINVVTPCEPGMTIDDSVETVRVMTGGGTIIEVDGVQMEMQIHDGIEQNQNNSTGENLITESEVLNEHDYGEVVGRNRFIGEVQDTTSEVEVELTTQPMECDEILTSDPGFSGQVDRKPILIMTGAGGYDILNNQGQVEHEPTSSSTTNNTEIDDINDLPIRKKKCGTDGKIRNIDLMDLPFSYAGQSFTVQAQKLILNVYDFFKRNKGDVYALDRIGTPQEKAGRCLNVSSSVIGKIRKRYKSGRLEVPGKRRAKIKRVLDKVDETQEQVLRGMLQEMMSNGIATTVPALLASAREKINFVGSRTSFRRVLHRMGFKYGKQNKKVVIVDGVRVSNSSQSQSQQPP